MKKALTTFFPPNRKSAARFTYVFQNVCAIKNLIKKNNTSSLNLYVFIFWNAPIVESLLKRIKKSYLD